MCAHTHRVRVWEGGRGGGNFMTGAAFNMNGGGGGGGGCRPPPKAMLDPPLWVKGKIFSNFKPPFAV